MDRDWLIRKHNDLRGWLWGLVPGLALIALLSVLGHGIWVAFFFFVFHQGGTSSGTGSTCGSGVIAVSDQASVSGS